MEKLLVRVRPGGALRWVAGELGKGGSQELKALPGLIPTLQKVQETERNSVSFSSLAPGPENQLTKKEKIEEGSLRWRVYHCYIRAAGGTVQPSPARPGAPSGASSAAEAGSGWPAWGRDAQRLRGVAPRGFTSHDPNAPHHGDSVCAPVPGHLGLVFIG